ncbi:hypothetical protein LINPERPRIM_LOCUS20401 [Linum perenne]
MLFEAAEEGDCSPSEDKAKEKSAMGY